MYNSIKLGCTKGDGLKNMKTSMKKRSIVTLEQEIVLVFSRHIIVRRSRGYYNIIEYHCPKGEYLYEIIVGPALRLFCLRKEQLRSIGAG